MKTLEQLSQQLDSLRDLRAIVSTMKGLSAVSIRQYEQAARSLALYYQTVERGLSVVLKDTPINAIGDAAAPSAAGGGLGLIVFGSDHGLCGRFNEQIADHARRWLAHHNHGHDQHLLAVGGRAAAALSAAGCPPEPVLHTPGSAEQITATVRQLLLNIDRWRQAHAVGQVYLFYNRHRSETGYQASDARLLPVDLARLRQLRQRQWPSRTLPTYHMARQPLLARLLRQYFYVSLFRACAESLASEHASRLAAMQSAERNLDQHLETVSGEYQRRRQDAITAELLDIVGGFEALAGDR